MSSANADIMRAALEAFNNRDGAGLDTLLAEDAVIVPVRAAIESITYRGPDAGSQYCAAVDDSWENLRWVLEEMRDGGDWVMGLGHIHGRGRDSGAVIDARGAWVAHFRVGRITHFQTYSDRDKAFEAVGLAG